MKKLLAAAALVALAAPAFAQTAVFGDGGFGQSASTSGSVVSSGSLAAPGAGLTFGTAEAGGQTSGFGIGVGSTFAPGAGFAASGSQNTSFGVTTGGSLGTAISASGADAAAGTDSFGFAFGGFGITNQ